MAQEEALELSVDQDNVWVCPHCGEEMKLVKNREGCYHVCESCGCMIEGLEQDCELGSVCPNCHQVMDGGECSYCGYDMGSDFS